MPVFAFLHVVTMFVAVAMAYGPAMLMVVASRRRDVRALRAITATSNRLGPFVGAAFAGVLSLASWPSLSTASTRFKAGS